MTINVLYRLIVLFSLGIFFWLYFSKEHNQKNTEEESIHLPFALQVFFGGKTSLHNKRGILGQLWISGIVLVYALNILGYISSTDIVKFFLIVLLINLVMYFLILNLFNNTH